MCVALAGAGRAGPAGQAATLQKTRAEQKGTDVGGEIAARSDIESKSAQETPVMSEATSLASSASSTSLNSSLLSTNSSENGGSSMFYDNKEHGLSTSSMATVMEKLANSTSTLNIDDAVEGTEAKPAEIGDLSGLNKSTSCIDLIQQAITSPTKIIKKKSSLKLPSLMRSKSLPSPSKTVRFSHDLTKVKTFNESEKPSSISMENTPDSSPPTSPSSLHGETRKTFFDLNGYSFDRTSSPWYTRNTSSSEDEDEDDFIKKKKWVIRCLNFNLFRAKFSIAPVKLTSITIENDSLIGLIQVDNLAFEKHVEVKFTIDNWKTIYIVNCSYSSSLGEKRDLFKFDLNLKNAFIIDSNNNPISCVELCVQYIAGNNNNMIFYDNNSNQNYKFQIIQSKKSALHNGSGRERLKKSNSYLRKHNFIPSSSTPSTSSSSSPSSPSLSSLSLPSSYQTSCILTNSPAQSSSTATSASESSEEYSSSEHLLSSASDSSESETSPAISSPPPPPPAQLTSNYTTSSRYFSDDTDYFNSNYSNAMKYLNTSNYEMLRPKIQQQLSSSSASSTETITLDQQRQQQNQEKKQTKKTSHAASLNSDEDHEGGDDEDITSEEEEIDPRLNYNEFLKRYCFFNSDDTKTGKETVFIS